MLADAVGVTLVDDPAASLYPMPLTATGKYDVEVCVCSCFVCVMFARVCVVCMRVCGLYACVLCAFVSFICAIEAGEGEATAFFPLLFFCRRTLYARNQPSACGTTAVKYARSIYCR